MFLPAFFHVLKLTLNLIYAGHLCDFGINVMFLSSGCHVHNPRTGYIIGIGRKVECMFELIHLHTLYVSKTLLTPSILPSSAPAPTSSNSLLILWHSYLGHVSIDQLQSLKSIGKLGSIKSEISHVYLVNIKSNQHCHFLKVIMFFSIRFDLIHYDV